MRDKGWSIKDIIESNEKIRCGVVHVAEKVR